MCITWWEVLACAPFLGTTGWNTGFPCYFQGLLMAVLLVTASPTAMPQTIFPTVFLSFIWIYF